MIKRVAIYCRKSRESEDKTTVSIDGQANVLIELCEQRGYEYDLYSETGSSQEWERPELQRMLSAVKRFEYDAIVCTETSRLTRNSVHHEFIKTVLVKAQCVVITQTSVIDYRNADQEFTGDILALMTKREYQEIRKRLIRGSRESAKKGHWLGKKTPFGYKYNRDSKTLEIIPEDAQIMTRMFKEYVHDGKSTTTIAYDFTNEGIENLKWSSSSIARMIANPAYAGHTLYGRTKQMRENGKRVVEQTREDDQILRINTHEPIIPQELFDEAQAVRNKRNSRPPALKLGRHKYSGLLRCGKCNNVHSFQTIHGKKRVTSCQSRLYQEDGTYQVCDNGGVYVKDVDSIFHLYLAEYVEQLEKYAHMLTNDNSNDATQEIERKERQIEKLNKDIKRIQQGWLMEIFEEQEAKEQIATLKEQMGMLTEQIHSLKTEQSVSESDKFMERLIRMKRFLTHGDSIEESKANDILREHIDSIIYTKEGNKINLRVILKE